MRGLVNSGESKHQCKLILNIDLYPLAVPITVLLIFLRFFRIIW